MLEYSCGAMASGISIIVLFFNDSYIVYNKYIILQLASDPPLCVGIQLLVLFRLQEITTTPMIRSTREELHHGIVFHINSLSRCS